MLEEYSAFEAHESLAAEFAPQIVVIVIREFLLLYGALLDKPAVFHPSESYFILKALHPYLLVVELDSLESLLCQAHQHRHALISLGVNASRMLHPRTPHLLTLQLYLTIHISIKYLVV